MNISDTQELESALEIRGWQQASLAKEADAVLINSCAVRQTAQDRVLAHLGFYKNLKSQKNFLLIFMGCVASSEKEKILEDYPFVDYVVSPSNRYLIPDLIESYESGTIEKNYPQRVLVSDDGGDFRTFLSPVVDRKYPFRAFLTIIQGCSKFCTYCIVPYTRGPEKSVPSEILLKDIRKFAKEGIKEIYLLGQNVDSYGLDLEDLSFAQLLHQVAQVPGIERLKFISSHPRDVNAELVEELARNPKVSRNLHLALQSGSDWILQKMNRQHTLAEFRETLHKLREMAPDFQVSTDIIVGFPFEGEGEYQETKQALIDLQFSHAFIYMYSEREGTAASRMQDVVPLEIKKQRAQELMEIQRGITQKILRQMIGKHCSILIEGRGTKPHQWRGFTEYGMGAFFSVSPESSKDFSGQMVRARVLDVHGSTLYTQLEDEG